jgi:hypothetical protein
MRAAPPAAEEPVIGRGESGVSPIPVAAWLLLGAAGIVLLVHVTRDWYQLFGPYLIIRPWVVSNALEAVAPFLLGAAVLIGVPRWQAGRRWFVAAVVTLGCLGVVRLVSDAVLALFVDDPSVERLQVALVVLGYGSSILIAAAPILLAIGLQVARPPTGRVALWLWLPVGVVAAVGVAGVVAPTAAWITMAPIPEGSVPFALAHGALRIAAISGMALLAISAAGAAPRRGALPERLIVIGAGLSAAVAGWTVWSELLLFVAEGDQPPQVLVDVLPLAVTLVGILCMAGGFALGRFSSRREPT